MLIAYEYFLDLIVMTFTELSFAQKFKILKCYFKYLPYIQMLSAVNRNGPACFNTLILFDI